MQQLCCLWVYPPKVAQERLGHSSYQITMDIYSHVLKKVEKEGTDKLDDALFNHS